MTRILVVEDDRALARGLLALLGGGEFAVDHATTGSDAVAVGVGEPYSLIILDIGFCPTCRDLRVLKTLRMKGVRAPVMMLTARDAVRDRVSGLDLGADDYLLKPFDPDELMARVRALVRRGQGDPSPTIQLGDLVLNRSTGEVLLNGESLDLRRRELAVLICLMARPGRLVSKERLSAEVFAFDDEVAPNALEVYVGRLRKKLGDTGPQIRTQRGLGYLIEEH